MGFLGLGNGAMMGIGQGLSQGTNNAMQLYMFQKEQEQKALQMAQQKAIQDAQIREILAQVAARKQATDQTTANSQGLMSAYQNAITPGGEYVATGEDPTTGDMQSTSIPYDPKMDTAKALTGMVPYLDKENAPKFEALLKIRELPLEEQKNALAQLVQLSQLSRNRAQEANALREPQQQKTSLKNETEEKFDEKTGIKFKRSFTFDPATGNKSNFSDWTPVGKEKQPDSVTVTTNVGSNSMEKLGEEMAKELVGQRKDVEGAASGLRNIEEAEKLLDAGIITGTGAEFLTNFGNFLSSRLGFKAATDPVANTQAYTSTMGNQVGQIIKQFGSGTGLSDADREYAEKIVGGKITLNEQALRKLIAINKKAFTNIVNTYNKKVSQAMKKPGAEGLPYDLRVEVGTTQEQSSPAAMTPPAAAIDYLKKNPKQAAFFDQKYGKGASKRYLGGK